MSGNRWERPANDAGDIPTTGLQEHEPSGPAAHPSGNASTWRNLAGATLYEQVKSVLAAVGLLAIVVGVLRAAR